MQVVADATAASRSANEVQVRPTQLPDACALDDLNFVIPLTLRLQAKAWRECVVASNSK